MTFIVQATQRHASNDRGAGRSRRARGELDLRGSTPFARVQVSTRGQGCLDAAANIDNRKVPDDSGPRRTAHERQPTLRVAGFSRDGGKRPNPIEGFHDRWCTVVADEESIASARGSADERIALALREPRQ